MRKREKEFQRQMCEKRKAFQNASEIEKKEIIRNMVKEIIGRIKRTSPENITDDFVLDGDLIERVIVELTFNVGLGTQLIGVLKAPTLGWFVENLEVFSSVR